MDHLNRHTYRSLLQQSQQTIDHGVFLHKPHDKLAVTEKTMEELNQIFNRFGLTPTDMNIPWRPGSPSPKGGGQLPFFDEDEDEDDEDEEEGGRTEEAAKVTPLALTPPALASPPQTPQVPHLELPVHISSVPVGAGAGAGMSTTEGKKNVVVNGNTAQEVESKRAAARLANKFNVKTYNPSSWRHEIIMKKEKGISKEVCI